MVHNYSDADWVKNFRMSRDTFMSLANESSTKKDYKLVKAN